MTRRREDGDDDRQQLEVVMGRRRTRRRKRTVCYGNDASYRTASTKSMPTTTVLVVAVICYILISSTSTSTFAWVPQQRLPHNRYLSLTTEAPNASTARRRHSRRTVMYSNSGDNDKQKADDEDDDMLSDIDARVLQSLLQDVDNKLDLQQEANMKKLLERGISSKEKVERPEDKAKMDNRVDGGTESEEIPYSSQVLQTLADTKLWRKLKRNAADWAESARIALSNRIERDAKLVASLGIFAFERALKDVGRALPAAGSAMKNSAPARKIFQLSDTSSYQEPPTKPESSSSSSEERDPTTRDSLSSADLRRELSTPQDEIRAVSKEIQQIFQDADQKVSNKKKVSPFFATRVASDRPQNGGANTLKSTARRGAARLDQAYKRQKQTTLAREKENVAQAGSRLASNIVDSAYQVQRELQVEPNEPGYKTKRLRQATASTARQIAAAARQTSANLLSGAKNNQNTRSSLPSTASSVVDDETTTTATPSENDEANPVDFLDQERYFAFKRETSTTPESTPVDDEDGIFDDDDDVVVDVDVDAKIVDVMDASVVSQSSTAIPTDVNVVDSNSFVDVVATTTATTTTSSNDDINYASIYADMASTGASTGSDEIDSGSGGTSTTTAATVDSGVTSTTINGNELDDDSIRQVMAEVISDDDFEGAVGDAKKVDNMSAEELLQALEAEENDGTNTGPPNILVQLSLRSLDVVFLVVEKVVLLVPVVVTVSTRVTTRFVEVSRDGLGQQGWQPLKTKIRGERRY